GRLPLHDTRGDRRQARAQVQAIEEELGRQGAWAEAPVSAAAGRALLALGELDEARRKLEGAFALGERSPATALALGRALGAIYERELESVRRMPAGPRRAGRQGQNEAGARRARA